MNKFFTRLKTQAEENPIVAVLVGAAALTAASKFISSASEAKGRRTWDREVARRERNSRR